MVPVKLSELGYEALSGYLLFREDTAVFRRAIPVPALCMAATAPKSASFRC